MNDDKDLDEILNRMKVEEYGTVSKKDTIQALNRHYYQKFLEMLEEQKSAAEKGLKYQVDKTGNQNLIREWTGTVQGIQFCIDAAKLKLLGGENG